jgi:hypothetical protein
VCNGKGALYYTAASSGICSRSFLWTKVRHDHVNRPISASVPGPCPPVGSIPSTTLSHAYGLPDITAAPSITHPKESDFHFSHSLLFATVPYGPLIFACSQSLA